MLHAIINNKAGRVEVNGVSVPLRQLYKEREDMITAAIFSRLPYLSEQVQRLLLGSLMPEAAVDFSQFVRTEFWPSFSSSLQERVEPDVVMRFEWGTLMVEVKRPLDGYQDGEQWYRELEALPEEYWEGVVVFWAVGGDKKHNQRLIDELEARLQQCDRLNGPVQFFATAWRELAVVVDRLLGAEFSPTKADIAILTDMLAALDLYSVQYRELKLQELCRDRLGEIRGAGCLADWIQPNRGLEAGLRAASLGFSHWPPISQLQGVARDAWRKWRPTSANRD
ncbi:hypothetical protein [Motiliproteus sp. SC1-56]|uniref:hypothetical protein n=1 Tax=Motiliproteus sp. SC1-56 TaxID=2799565 RepID=UPI001A8D3662|nr:hypothetical protein [Motiliproteus sp. SC1-56]